MGNLVTVFSKPWKEKSIEELADLIVELGLDGVELPVRDGFQVTPERIAKDLPKAAKVFESRGLKIHSVAGPETEEAIAPLGESGVPILRMCPKIDMSIGYMASIEQHRRRWDALLPALEKHGLTIGVQNHAGYNVGSALGLVHLVEKYDPKQVGIVLDPGHCGLDGEPDDMAIDIAWPHLVLVNLKNSFRRIVSGLEDGDVKWATHWTTGRMGFSSWPTVVAELKKRGYQGAYCLTAEYRNWDGPGDLTGDAVDPLIAKDVAYARALLGD